MMTSPSKNVHASSQIAESSIEQLDSSSEILDVSGFPHQTVGVDLGNRLSHYCILDLQGNVVRRGKLPTALADMQEFFSKLRLSRVALEASPHASWIHDLLVEMGHEVVVANPRELDAVSKSKRKSDVRDAEKLARLARADVHLLSPIKIRGGAARKVRSLLKTRDGLVRCRTKLINLVRGVIKCDGLKVSSNGTSRTFHRRAAEELPQDMLEIVGGVLETLEVLTERIKAYDDQLDQLARETYPNIELLTQVQGVGTLTALAFMSSIEDPSRFAKSRDVGPFFGLVPGRDQSGDGDPERRITKQGDAMVRKLLVQASHYIFHHGTDSDLQRAGYRIAGNGGKKAKKRAVVAVARKLAILLHHLWATGQVWDPLCNSRSAGPEETSSAA